MFALCTLHICSIVVNKGLHVLKTNPEKMMMISILFLCPKNTQEPFWILKSISKQFSDMAFILEAETLAIFLPTSGILGENFPEPTGITMKKWILKQFCFLESCVDMRVPFIVKCKCLFGHSEVICCRFCIYGKLLMCSLSWPFSSSRSSANIY